MPVPPYVEPEKEENEEDQTLVSGTPRMLYVQSAEETQISSRCTSHTPIFAVITTLLVAAAMVAWRGNWQHSDIQREALQDKWQQWQAPAADTATTATTTKWHPDVWWLENVWESKYTKLCEIRTDNSAPKVYEPALTKDALTRFTADPCKSLSANSCMWTVQYPCPSWANQPEQEDGTMGRYCCCMRKRDKAVTQSPAPFSDDAFTAKGGKMTIKVLSYNLQWWKLFGAEQGNGGSAGKLVAKSHGEMPFDFMGFQECQDKERVLADAGIAGAFETFQDESAHCMAFRKAAWRLIANGYVHASHDTYWNNYGVRGTQWMRLMHVESERTLLFMNHHGPLSVNSGGVCGGVATARNILKIATTHGEAGDIIILVGDFNSNAASYTLQELRKRLHHTCSGGVLGGLDNVLTNLPVSALTECKDLGSGGSDHHALSAIFEVEEEKGDVLVQRRLRPWTPKDEPLPGTLSQKEADLNGQIVSHLRDQPSHDDWDGFWCGLMEMDANFSIADSAWQQTIDDGEESKSPDYCCRACQDEERCKSWIYQGVVGQFNPPVCVLTDAIPTEQSKGGAPGYVWGLATGSAIDAVAESYERLETRLTPLA
eukprot:TRINITY_DN77333_c0_g1_i1.p1 TRINITY_DN77333_c0_g1~~TRINITY_DN77333_c0_g1_i1.p1  ORF type:complete len:600 (-),score=112.11 TRINITY_DN77333_c0_g1_i1:148-1947(-)